MGAMPYRIPNWNARNEMGKIIKRCVICHAPGDFHYPDGSLCASCALKSGMLGK